MTPTRRETIVGFSALLATACESRSAADDADWFAQRETELGGGQVGVFAQNLTTGATLSHRADQRFALCSTFKWLLAGFVLKATFDGRRYVRPPSLIVRREDLVPYAPVTAPALGDADQVDMSVLDLCAAAVSLSDNVAANVLLRTIGGPEGFTAQCRAIGDDQTRLDRWEPALNENKSGDLRDTTTPRAMTQTLGTILFTDALLNEEDRGPLRRWMRETKTGDTRLRAGFPPGWVVGDKTGTSMNGAVNDVAFARTANGEIIIVSSYINAPSADRKAADAVHAQIAAKAAQSLTS